MYWRGLFFLCILPVVTWYILNFLFHLYFPFIGCFSFPFTLPSPFLLSHEIILYPEIQPRGRQNQRLMEMSKQLLYL